LLLSFLVVLARQGHGLSHDFLLFGRPVEENRYNKNGEYHQHDGSDYPLFQGPVRQLMHA
jgi:hypothetical protein